MALVAGGSKSIGDETRELPNLQKLSVIYGTITRTCCFKINNNKNNEIQANLTE